MDNAANTFTVDGLRELGFQGFVGARSAYLDRCAQLPSAPGVYVLLRPSRVAPEFDVESRGGWFKGRNPTVELSTLQSKWVTETPVVYIGKATSLRSRVRQLVDFGNGKPIGHWGGRYLWQLRDADDLVLAWRIETDPRTTEARLIEDFVDKYGARPFANLAG